MSRKRCTPGSEGFALITALGILIVFMLIGTAWLGYMAIEQQKTAFETNNIKAQYAARGGIADGIAEIQKALASGKAPDLGAARELEVPVYGALKEADTAPEAREDSVCRVKVALSDEEARININFAPANVLRKILDVDGEKARQIRSSLPRLEGDTTGTDSGDRKWFASVDELVTRNLVDQSRLTPELSGMLTVYSVPDPAKPVAYMNINSAPAPVLEALLDITPDVAQKVVEARANRPFTDVTELSAAAGKDPATFNVRPAPDALNTLPPELCFASRCYRIVSTSVLARTPEGGERVLGRGYAEAVVCFDDGGAPHVMYWSETAPEQVQEVTPDAAPESTPAKAE